MSYNAESLTKTFLNKAVRVKARQPLADNSRGDLALGVDGVVVEIDVVSDPEHPIRVQINPRVLEIGGRVKGFSPLEVTLKDEIEGSGFMASPDVCRPAKEM
jgi:hypothetical protein